MYLELFGYRLYPAFFAAIIGIPLLVIGAIILFKRQREKKAVYRYSTITNWQKNRLGSIIKEDLGEDEEDLAEAFEEYLDTNDYWNDEELLEIDENIIRFVNKKIFNFIKENYQKDKNRCVLALHAMDVINSGLDFESGRLGDWISEDFPAMENHEDMGVNEGRLMTLILGSVQRVDELYVLLDTEEIPKLTLAIPELVGTRKEDVERVIEDIVESYDFTELKDSSYDFIASCLIDNFIEIEKSIIRSQIISSYYLAYIRALACVLDKSLYPDILETIEG